MLASRATCDAIEGRCVQGHSPTIAAAPAPCIKADPLDRFTDNPARLAEMRTCLQAQAANGTNPAVLLYMVDALQYFKDKPTAQIKETAFEIALLDTQGIEPAK